VLPIEFDPYQIQSAKPQHRRGFQGQNGWNGTPDKDFYGLVEVK
jgi:hypothetical protein